MTQIKFCGMTREEDVRQAVRLGASYVGVILTESPRRVVPEVAAALLSPLAHGAVKRVGVFGDQSVDEIIHDSRVAGLDVVQLHGRTIGDPAALTRLRAALALEFWRVVRVGPDGLTDEQRDLVSGTEGVLLDTLTWGALGGTGVRFSWTTVSADVRALRGHTKVILAGGLRPENVREAIDLLAPDVVDVSSGVELGPGIKDHARMAAFIEAVRQTSSAPVQ